MGFRPIGENESITAVFHSLHVYEVQGFTMSNESLINFGGHISEFSYEVAVGNNVNELSKILVGDDLAEDEAAWLKENQSTPPYVIIHIGPTSKHSCATGHIKMEGSNITTFETFTAAKAELKNIEQKVLPSVIAALTCSFNADDNHVKFRQLSREVFGLTPTGSVVHDVRIDFNASGYVSRGKSKEALMDSASKAVSLAADFNPKVAMFIQLALQEDDLLKRFLYFFLSIEVEIHSAFSSIDHSANISRIVNCEGRITTSTIDLFKKQNANLKSLSDKFVWCALCVWAHVTDEDIAEFNRLKKFRNDIAHGSISEPPPEAVVAIEKLAIKLYRK